MAGGGEFLAGLLAGLSDSYREGASENRRITLMKQQLEQQNRIAEAQISLAKSAQESRERIEGKHLELQAELGRGGLNLDWAKLGSADKQATLGRAHDIYMAAIHQAYQSGNMKLASELEADRMKLGFALGEQGKDQDVGRAIATHRGISLIDEGHKKELLDIEKQHREAFAKLTGETFEQKKQMELDRWAREFAAEVGGMELGRDAKLDELVAQTRLQVGANVAMADPAKVPSAIAALDLVTKDLNAGFGQRAISARAKIAPLLKAVAANDSAAAQAAITEIVGSVGAAESRPAGGETGKINVTKPTTLNEYVRQNPPRQEAWKRVSGEDVQRSVMGKPQLADALKVAYERQQGTNPFLIGMQNVLNTEADKKRKMYDWAASWLNAGEGRQGETGETWYRLARLLDTVGAGVLDRQSLPPWDPDWVGRQDRGGGGSWESNGYSWDAPASQPTSQPSSQPSRGGRPPPNGVRRYTTGQ